MLGRRWEAPTLPPAAETAAAAVTKAPLPNVHILKQAKLTQQGLAEQIKGRFISKYSTNRQHEHIKRCMLVLRQERYGNNNCSCGEHGGEKEENWSCTTRSLLLKQLFTQCCHANKNKKFFLLLS